MATFKLFLGGVLCLILCHGCNTYEGDTRVEGAVPLSASYNAELGVKERAAEQDATDAALERMLIWRANLSLSVRSIEHTLPRVITLVEQQQGFIENESSYNEDSMRLTVRIPMPRFKQVLSELEQLGSVTYKNLSVEDVTENYVDIKARLKNKLVLRDRLQALLERAEKVGEVLELERELSRVQADIDSMEGRLKLLEGQAQYASLQLRLERKVIYGPLGYLGKGLWWGLEKLFIIRG